MMLKTDWQSKSHLLNGGQSSAFCFNLEVPGAGEPALPACRWGEQRGCVSSVWAALLSCCDSSQDTCHQTVQLHEQQLLSSEPAGAPGTGDVCLGGHISN